MSAGQVHASIIGNAIIVPDPADAAIPRTRLKQIVDAYADAVSAADADAIAALFAEDAVRIDPVGSEPRQGRDAIRDAVRRALPGPPATLHFRPGPLRGGHNIAAFSFEHATTCDGITTVLRGIDVFAFTPEGLIAFAAAYWGTDDRN